MGFGFLCAKKGWGTGLMGRGLKRIQIVASIGDLGVCGIGFGRQAIGLQYSGNMGVAQSKVLAPRTYGFANGAAAPTSPDRGK
jgi:hypothetical protein